MGSGTYSDGSFSGRPIFHRPKVKQPTIADYMPSADMVEEIIKLQKELGKYKQTKGDVNGERKLQ